MDWKSTAVISGAGILATWFFSMPPTNEPASAVAPAGRAPQSTLSTIDIEKEAARLQVRPPQEQHYTEPSRNPFRFGERREPARATTGVAAPSPPVPIAPLPPPPPRITLDGVAADVVGGENQRTAVLNTDAVGVIAMECVQDPGDRVGENAADAVRCGTSLDGWAL